jgi:hypothetical protein
VSGHEFTRADKDIFGWALAPAARGFFAATEARELEAIQTIDELEREYATVKEKVRDLREYL